MKYKPDVRECRQIRRIVVFVVKFKKVVHHKFRRKHACFGDNMIKHLSLASKLLKQITRIFIKIATCAIPFLVYAQ